MKFAYSRVISTTTAIFLASLASALGADQNANAPGWQAVPAFHMRAEVTAAPKGYAPVQIRHAYGLDKITNNGAGQTIAIVEAYGSPTIQNDLNAFCTQYSLAKITLQFVYGGVKPAKTDPIWALETSLDVEWAHALAPSAKIIVAVAPTSSVTDLVAAVDAAVAAGATVVSMSWAGPEFAGETNYETHFKKAGVTFLASSGDNGSVNSWPAASPSVVSVGGTSLYLDAKGNRTSPEAGWSGSGGGLSTYFARPAYQTGWQAHAQRAFPDVSLVADPNTGVAIYDSTPFSGLSGWFMLGGTSASAPMWGAIIALTNQQLASSGKPNLSGAQAALYTLAGSKTSIGLSLYGTYYFDVSLGSNGGFTATARFDEVTGLGTSIASTMVPALGK